MKKKVVRSMIFFAIAALVVSCQYTERHDPKDMDGMLRDFIDGKVIIPVEKAFELYDGDTSGVIFLDVRDAASFSKMHEPGAVNIPSAILGKLKKRELPSHGEGTFLVYSDGLQRSIDSWFELKWKDLEDVKVILGVFDPTVGMLMDVSLDPSVDYGSAFSGALERLTYKPPAPPPAPPAPKKTIQVKKKKVVVEEEEGC